MKTLPILVGLLCASSALAEAPASQPTSKPASAPATPAKGDQVSITEGSVTIDGQSIAYTATAGTLQLKEETGKPRANFFYVAYEKKDAGSKATRPITFVFNGGPGAAAVWLHLGALGPKRVDLTDDGSVPAPPNRLVENTESWLDQTDLVFIDPVGTGYSRPVEGVEMKEFTGVQNDLNSVGEFIRLYITRNSRWNSPKFLAGESYGTTRAAALSDHLASRLGIAVNGITLISTVLDFQTISQSPTNDISFALFFPTYVAAAWHHKQLSPELQEMKLNDLLDRAQTFALDRYLPALAHGAGMSAEDRQKTVSEYSLLTSIPVDEIAERNLRVSAGEFRDLLLKKSRQAIGRFDARVVSFTTGRDEDPSLPPYYTAYAQTFNSYVRETLQYESDLPYEVLSGRVHPWNMGDGYLNVADELQRAMIGHHQMKVMVCSGHNDLATPFAATDYTIHRMDLSDELRRNITLNYYDAGHMLYHNAVDRRKLHADMKAFYQSALGAEKK